MLAKKKEKSLVFGANALRLSASSSVWGNPFLFILFHVFCFHPQALSSLWCLYFGNQSVESVEEESELYPIFVFCPTSYLPWDGAGPSLNWEEWERERENERKKKRGTFHHILQPHLVHASGTQESACSIFWNREQLNDGEQLVLVSFLLILFVFFTPLKNYRRN